jgi:hypothetical protein
VLWTGQGCIQWKIQLMSFGEKNYEKLEEKEENVKKKEKR